MQKNSKSKNVIMIDISVINNPICHVLLLHNINQKTIDNVKYIKKRNNITFLNKEKVGKFIGAFSNKEKKFHIYTNEILQPQFKPNQIIFLPKTKLNFPVYIHSFKTTIDSKILYKHLP